MVSVALGLLAVVLVLNSINWTLGKIRDEVRRIANALERMEWRQQHGKIN